MFTRHHRRPSQYRRRRPLSVACGSRRHLLRRPRRHSTRSPRRRLSRGSALPAAPDAAPAPVPPSRTPPSAVQHRHPATSFNTRLY